MYILGIMIWDLTFRVLEIQSADPFLREQEAGPLNLAACPCACIAARSVEGPPIMQMLSWLSIAMNSSGSLGPKAGEWRQAQGE